MKYYIYLLAGLLAFSCDKKSNNDNLEPQNTVPLDLTKIDNGNRVMMQAFYWDVTPLGEWWNTITPKLTEWKANGVDRIWLPPASKGASGGLSMGYDPSDYFDFGEYFQHGTVKTRFGSRAELENLISKAHESGLQVIADIVIGHNNGGGKEWNPYRNKETYTLFDETHGNASGRFNRNYECFHPNKYATSDEEENFYPERDLSHKVPYVREELWEKDNSMAKYYKNTMKFDGWRFDYVKSFGAWVVRDWLKAVGGFAVGELWDGNPETLKKWVDESGASAFDFACFYALEKALDRNKDMHELMTDTHPMLRTLRTEKAVTFTANHDTEKDKIADNTIAPDKKLMAYAYILTHSGYPCIFYSDYENEAFKAKLQKLMLINRSLAVGEEKFHLASNTEYVASRLGNEKSPGLVLFINNSTLPAKRTITTHWKNKTLIDYSGNSHLFFITDSDGNVTIQVPANSYTVWSIGK
ncbi:alpha-amylase [Capnocytophaga sp. oral taxon 324]|uniref:alpha-amylase n=1 Tax=Capnocytophaga sp. oral taxon 324 TaxID=712211 RepID=UPI0002A3B6C1|nr:alpha-amylase [Capnocytophaga sp. oral taxon 324]EKY13271.1 cytoplasmic alpha-amylase [Capnocytophaga sp. oral taxon 324 str. F0483]